MTAPCRAKDMTAVIFVTIITASSSDAAAWLPFRDHFRNGIRCFAIFALLLTPHIARGPVE